MNQFLQSAQKLIKSHGWPATYKTVTTGAYDVNTGAVSNSETNTVITTYRKGIVANQYNYPNLIGKELNSFWILKSDLSSEPKAQDKIVQDGKVHQVIAVRAYAARGEVIFFEVTTVKA